MNHFLEFFVCIIPMLEHIGFHFFLLFTILLTLILPFLEVKKHDSLLIISSFICLFISLYPLGSIQTHIHTVVYDPLFRKSLLTKQLFPLAFAVGFLLKILRGYLSNFSKFFEEKQMITLKFAVVILLSYFVLSRFITLIQQTLNFYAFGNSTLWFHFFQLWLKDQ